MMMKHVMMSKRLFIALAAAVLAGSSVRAGIAPFKEGDRVVFLGDSITHGGRYVADLQYFWSLRNPGRELTLVNCGICGNRAADGISRFAWDVVPERPNRVFILFGMNDVFSTNVAVRSQVWNPAATGTEVLAARREVVETYRRNLRTLIGKCREIGAAVTLLTPTPYDQYNVQIGKPASVGANEPGLATLAAEVRALAAEEHVEFVEFHEVLTPILRANPHLKFLSDRVHPHGDGHLLMAALVFEAMGTGAEFDGATFDASDGKRSFTYSPSRLPLPANDDYRQDDRLYPITERINREIIRIVGLPTGAYLLKAGGRGVGTYSAAELARGVNIATLDTPSQRKAQEGVAKVVVPLKKLAGRLRGLPQGYVQVMKRGGDIDDRESCFAKLDEWVEELRVRNEENGHYYRYYKAEVERFKKLYPNRESEKARLNELRKALIDWCRPEQFEIAVAVVGSASADAAGFSHGLTGTKPWTNENFLDDPQEFHFAVIGDRTGGERPGFFGKAMESLNLLRPEFTICVGDLVAGGGVSEPALRKQWAEATDFISRLEMPFFHVVGNHDIWTGFSGRTPERQTAIDVWKELHGTNTYYSFTYKNCLFLTLDVMEEAEYFPPREPVPQHQLDWAVGEFEKHRDARWRFIFMHKPLDWTSDRWLAFEKRIAQYDYTVFCGDWHNFCTADRNGRKYYMLGTVGGGHSGSTGDDLRYGNMDGITWVTVTKNAGPVVSHIALSGIHGDTIQTCATTRGWIEAPLDRPSHRSENPAQYAGERNSALVPTEVMHGPGYDWHFRHAIILRTGRCLQVGYEKLPEGKKCVVLLGDETASARAADFGDEWCSIDMGFKGDRIENVLWRVIEGELLGFEPQKVVISVGAHNKGVNTSDEIAAGLRKLESYVRARAPQAEIELVR